MYGEPGRPPEDAIVDGLTLISAVADDISIGKAGAGLYRDVRGAIDGQFRSDDVVYAAFPSIYMEAREPALVVVFADRVVLAWTKGLFKPKTVLDVVPHSQVISARVAPGTGANHRATLLTLDVEGRGALQIALPSEKPEVAAQVLAWFGFGAAPTA